MQNVRTVNRFDGSLSAQGNTVMFGRFKSNYAAGAGAGTSRTVSVTGIANLPADYSVEVIVPEDATAYVTAKTTSGFTINILPRLAANTLAGGVVEYLIWA